MPKIFKATINAPIIFAKGLSGQTADLQQWQTSAGVILGSVTAGGVQTATQPTPSAQNASVTLTIANLLTGIITTTSTVGVTLTLPTGTLSDGGFVSLSSDLSFDWSIINTGSSAGSISIAGGTGHTYVGNATISLGTSARFRSRRSSANTWVTYRIS